MPPTHVGTEPRDVAEITSQPNSAYAEGITTDECAIAASGERYHWRHRDVDSQGDRADTLERHYHFTRFPGKLPQHSADKFEQSLKGTRDYYEGDRVFL